MILKEIIAELSTRELVGAAVSVLALLVIIVGTLCLTYGFGGFL